eukprot:TRINITY_DN8377_c0_g1_i2.p1 TRINITY_DN8377_c0_g1~~TRINITY_DN8377_c0_g1_i2.p1  ORF type:complete len:198 (-),score=25.26 TRINITY_DN8377_c0_g1_i2:20-613(-)
MSSHACCLHIKSLAINIPSHYRLYIVLAIGIHCIHMLGEERIETKTKTYVNLRNGKAAFNEDLNFTMCTSQPVATFEIHAITPSSSICVLGTSSLNLSLYCAAKHADAVLRLQKCVDRNALLQVAVTVGGRSVERDSQRRARSIAAQGICMHSPSLSRAAINKLVKEGIGSVSGLSLIHICRCRRYAVCRSRWSPYH